MPRSVDALPLFAPIHIVSVFDVFILRPEHSWKVRRSLNKFSAEFVSDTKAVVSSAYCEILNSLS